jgi:type VI secretion system secreted protein Hcp
MRDIYVEFKNSDIKGETRDAKHGPNGAIEAASFEQSIRQPKSSSASTAGGHTAERTEHGEMIFSKEADSATTKLWQACSAGTVIKEVDIYLYRAFGGQDKTTQSGNKRVNYLKISLKNCVISSFSTSIAAGAELPSETFGLRYSSAQWNYTEAPIDGGTAKHTNVIGQYNLKTNEVAFAA